MDTPGGATPYYPSKIDLSLIKDIQFFRDPSWLADVTGIDYIQAGYEEGAGLSWNTATGFALKLEVDNALRPRSAEGKEITAEWLKTVLPSRPGTNPYVYWPRFTGKINPKVVTPTTTAVAVTAAAGGLSLNKILLYATLGIVLIGVILIFRRATK